MRSLILSAVLGLGSLGLFLGPAAPKADAQWGWRGWRSGFYYPTYSYYGPGYYSPYYGYPTYYGSYYPTYSYTYPTYTVPTYSYYYATPAYSTYYATPYYYTYGTYAPRYYSWRWY